MPAQRDSPLPRCLRAPPPHGAGLASLPTHRRHSTRGGGGAGRHPQGSHGTVPRTPARAPGCCPAQPCRGGTTGPIRSWRRWHSQGSHGWTVARSHLTVMGKGQPGVGTEDTPRQGLWVLGKTKQRVAGAAVPWRCPVPTCRVGNPRQGRPRSQQPVQALGKPGQPSRPLPCPPPRPCLSECFCQGKVPVCSAAPGTVPGRGRGEAPLPGMSEGHGQRRGCRPRWGRRTPPPPGTAGHLCASGEAPEGKES